MQKAIQLVLEEIYQEKLKFSHEVSYGVRFKRGCHIVLKSIKQLWTGIP